MSGGGLGRNGRDELVRLPVRQDVFKPGKQAGEGRQNQGVQSRDRPVTGGLVGGPRTDVGQDDRQVLGQRGVI